MSRLPDARWRREWRRGGASLVAFGAAVGVALCGPARVAAAPGPVALLAPDDDVEAIVAEAVEKFQAKEYDEAVALFEQAYAISPEPNYLFNIGRVYEQAGQLERAVEYYGRFVKLPEVDLGAREVALDRLRVLRGVLEETAAKKPPPEEPVEDPANDPEADPAADPTGDDPTSDPKGTAEPERDKPNGMRIGGFVLLGVGAGVAVGGAVFGGLALQRESDLNTLNTLEGRTDAVSRGKRNALAADIMFGLGGAMVVTGVVLVALSYGKGRNGGRQRASLSPSFSRRGGGVVAQVRF